MSPRQRRELVSKAMSPKHQPGLSNEKQKYMVQHLNKMQKLSSGIIRQKKKENGLKKKLQHKGRNSALGPSHTIDAS